MNPLIILTILLFSTSQVLAVESASPANSLQQESQNDTIFASFVPIITLLFTITILAFIYTYVIKPYQAIQFYRDQGIPMMYSPIIGSFSKDLDNVMIKGDYYSDWLEISKQEPRPQAMGKNVAQHPQLYLIDPEAVKQFFNNTHNYIKHPFFNALTKELGENGLVMAEGKYWNTHRKLLSNAFQFDMLKNTFPDIVHQALSLIGRYEKNPATQKNFDILDELRDIGGEVIGNVFFDESIGGYKMHGQPLTVFLAHLIARLSVEPYYFSYLVFGLPLVKAKIIPRQRQLINDIRDFRELCRMIVRRHMDKRREDNKKGLYPYKTRLNMFDIFFNHELANPSEAFTEDELVDEYITFFSDGVYTVGHFISMTTYFLVQNPEWKQKVMDEMDTLFPTLDELTYDNIAKLDVLSACMKESFRMAPPVVTAVERLALHDHELAGMKMNPFIVERPISGTCGKFCSFLKKKGGSRKRVKKGTILSTCHIANYLDERFFEDPSTYNPDRWLKPSKSQESVTKYPSLFIPFSIGPRRCIGQNFAMNEAKVIMTVFMKKFKFELSNKNYKLRFTHRFLREPLDPVTYDLTPKETNFKI